MTTDPNKTWIRQSSVAAWSFYFRIEPSENPATALRPLTLSILRGLGSFATLREIERISRSAGEATVTYTSQPNIGEAMIDEIFGNAEDVTDVTASLDLSCVDELEQRFTIEDAGSLFMDGEDDGVYVRLVIDADIYAATSWAGDRDNQRLARLNGPRLTSFLGHLRNLGGEPRRIDAISYAGQVTWSGFRFPAAVED